MAGAGKKHIVQRMNQLLSCECSTPLGACAGSLACRQTHNMQGGQVTMLGLMINPDLLAITLQHINPPGTFSSPVAHLMRVRGVDTLNSPLMDGRRVCRRRAARTRASLLPSPGTPAAASQMTHSRDLHRKQKCDSSHDVRPCHLDGVNHTDRHLHLVMLLAYDSTPMFACSATKALRTLYPSMCEHLNIWSALLAWWLGRWCPPVSTHAMAPVLIQVAYT
jgi:hypothetical protein